MKEENEKAGLNLNIQKVKIMASGTMTFWQIDGEKFETVTNFTFLGSKITADGDRSHKIWKHLLFGKRSYDKPRQYIKKQKHYFADKGVYSQRFYFSSSHVWMWELDNKEGWLLKNWCFRLWFWRTLRVLDCKVIKPINPKWNQSWVFIGIFIGIFQYFGYLMWRTDSLEKTLMLEKIEIRRRRGLQKMRWMDGWHHRLDRHEFE